MNCECEGSGYHIYGGPVNYNGAGGPHLLRCIPLRNAANYAMARQVAADVPRGNPINYWARLEVQRWGTAAPELLEALRVLNNRRTERSDAS